jgi:hypothetical protein
VKSLVAFAPILGSLLTPNCLTSQPRKSGSANSLGITPSWAASRRKEYKKGVLSAERVRYLETLTGWVWDPFESDYQEAIGHFNQYVEEYGNATIPRRYKTEDGFRLGNWVSKNCKSYKKVKLSTERIKFLKNYSWLVWEAS